MREVDFYIDIYFELEWNHGLSRLYVRLDGPFLYPQTGKLKVSEFAYKQG